MDEPSTLVHPHPPKWPLCSQVLCTLVRVFYTLHHRLSLSGGDPSPRPDPQLRKYGISVEDTFDALPWVLATTSVIPCASSEALGLEHLLRAKVMVRDQIYIYISFSESVSDVRSIVLVRGSRMNPKNNGLCYILCLSLKNSQATKTNLQGAKTYLKY